jgi:hypothetical protein
MANCSAETWRIREAFVDADPEHQKLAAVHTHQIELAQKQQQQIRAGLYRLQRLLLARDIIQRKVGDFCDLTAEQEETLALTGQDSEAWYCDFDNAADDLTELAATLCGEITTARATLERLEAKREEAWQARRDCAAALRKTWDETHGEQSAS